MPTTSKKKPSPAQIAARKAFAERARSGGFKRRKKVATSGAKVKQRASKAPSPAQLAARKKFVAMVRARAAAKKGGRRRNVAGDSSVKSPTRTSSDVRSPTRTATSTEAQTSGNVTVTGGAGRGATTRVDIHTAAPRGTKAKVGKKKNSRGFSGAAPAWTRSKKAKRNGVLLTNGFKVSDYSFKVGGRHVRKATQVTTPTGKVVKFTEKLPRAKAIKQAQSYLKKNPIRMSESEARRYAPKIKGLTLVSVSAPAKRKKKAARFGKPAKRAMARAFSGSGLLGLGRSRKTVRVNKRKAPKNPSMFSRAKDYKSLYGKRRIPGHVQRRVAGKGSKSKRRGGGYASQSFRFLGAMSKGAKRLPNPSPASVFSEFRGKEVASKSKATFHGNATGAVAQLGHLRELKLVGKKLEFGGNALLCADGRKRLHIGGVRFKASGAEEDMGEVRSVTYRSDKPHIESGVLDYVHKFAEDGGKCPHLVVDAEGYPFLEGGSYKIDADGIIN